MSPHEECAVELAVQVAEATGGAATVLTLGDADAVEQLRTALAVGLHGGDARRGRRGRASARPTSPARSRRWSEAHEAAGRAYDLVLLGNDAADSGDFQVGIRLAYELGRPVVNGVSTLEVVDGDGSSAHGRRPRRGTRPTRCRPPWSPRSSRAASSRATRASRAG